MQIMDDSFGEFFKLTERVFKSLYGGNIWVRVCSANTDAKEKRENSGDQKSKPKHFEIERKEITDDKGKVVDTQLIIVITSRVLRDYLRGEIASEELYEQQPRLKAYELLVCLNQLKERLNEDYSTPEESPLYELIKVLDEEYGDLTKKLDSMIAEGYITFQYLWYYFKKGTHVWGYEQSTEGKLGVEVISSQYRSFMMFTFFSISGYAFISDGQRIYQHTHEFTIAEFKGMRKITDLPVRLLDEKTRVELIERGKLWKRVAIGTHYMQYKGNIIRKHWFGSNYFKADGRVMVDGANFRRLNPNYENDAFRHRSHDPSSDELEESQLWMTWPSVLGFSFGAKKWGEILVSNLSDIVFDDTAFDRLVLPQEKKNMIRALVENQRGAVKDLISGKGGGCIFLLHGAPGVGKTLTSEAIAELLHKPLYSVSVGELGTETDILEERLREILEVASTWQGVVLLDEADIFLEKRTETDIKRNAMVGIFLRLLEYHNGVLFLTTNRVRSFDPAFHSRISVALKYSDLDEMARRQVWQNFLTHANIDSKDIDVNELAKYELNGRNIKTIVRISQALAMAEGKPVTGDHIMRTMGVTEQFKRDILKASQSDLY